MLKMSAYGKGFAHEYTYSLVYVYVCIKLRVALPVCDVARKIRNLNAALSRL